MHVSWYEVFDDALGIRSVVAVSQVAEAHLGRTPTRSEVTSAPRAANSYARRSNAQTLHVAGRRTDGRRVQALLLARADADLDDTDQLQAVVSGRAGLPRTRGRPRGTQGVESLLTAIVHNAHSARRVDIEHVDPGHAAHLADDLADALNDLRHLRDRLHHLAHQDPAVAGPTSSSPQRSA